MSNFIIFAYVNIKYPKIIKFKELFILNNISQTPLEYAEYLKDLNEKRI